MCIINTLKHRWSLNSLYSIPSASGTGIHCSSIYSVDLCPVSYISTFIAYANKLCIMMCKCLWSASVVKRFGNALVKRKTFFASLTKCSICDSVNVHPILKAFCFSINSDIHIIGFISKLSMICCPSAIFRRIRTIIVNPINSKSWFIRSYHIIVKGFKRIPSLAYSNSSATISRIISIFRAKTSSSHPLPSGIYRRFTKAMSFWFHNLILLINTCYRHVWYTKVYHLSSTK